MRIGSAANGVPSPLPRHLFPSNRCQGACAASAMTTDTRASSQLLARITVTQYSCAQYLACNRRHVECALNSAPLVNMAQVKTTQQQHFNNIATLRSHSMPRIFRGSGGSYFISAGRTDHFINRADPSLLMRRSVCARNP
jgi:hypothetical protein